MTFQPDGQELLPKFSYVGHATYSLLHRTCVEAVTPGGIRVESPVPTGYSKAQYADAAFALAEPGSPH